MKKMTVTEYSLYTNSSRQNIYARIKRGTIKSVIVDGVVYVEVNENEVNEKTIDTTSSHSSNKTIVVNELTQFKDSIIQDLKQEIQELKEQLKHERELNHKLNSLLNKEKDNSIDILYKFINEMKAITYTPKSDNTEKEKKKNKK